MRLEQAAAPNPEEGPARETRQARLKELNDTIPELVEEVRILDASEDEHYEARALLSERIRRLQDERSLIELSHLSEDERKELNRIREELGAAESSKSLWERGQRSLNQVPMREWKEMQAGQVQEKKPKGLLANLKRFFGKKV